MYTNQTGKFPKKSSKGNQYIMVLIKIDSNVILVEAIKNRSAEEMIRAYLILVNCLRNAGVTPKMHILDNRCSEEFKAQIHKNNMTFQLVPPHDHQRNIAEKAIQTFKGHFISILCGTDCCCCAKHSALTFSKGCSDMLMSSTSTQGKRGGAFSYPNLLVIS